MLLRWTPAAAEGPRGLSILSPREWQVLRAYVAGAPRTPSARRLGISVHTVATVRQRVLDKLGLDSTAAMLRYAVERGVGEHDDPAAR